VRAQVGQAQSQVQVAEAKLAHASDVDVLIAQARARADAAHAEAETRRSARDTAALELSYTKVYAPIDGTVSKKSVTIGQLTPLGQAVAQLVPSSGRWVTANFKETQLAEMRVGQSAEIEVDVYSGAKVQGEVESLSGATGARFAMFPPDNATGNFTKVVQRVPVRIRIREVANGIELRPGLSAVVTVDTRK
jgi:membrane fusion protein (multidrug efflux system)